MPDISMATPATNKEVVVLYVPTGQSEYIPDRVHDVLLDDGVLTWRCVGQEIPSGAQELLRFWIDPLEYADIRKLFELGEVFVKQLEEALAAIGIHTPINKNNGRPQFHPLGLAYYVIRSLIFQTFGKGEYYREAWGYARAGAHPVFATQ